MASEYFRAIRRHLYFGVAVLTAGSVSATIGFVRDRELLMLAGIVTAFYGWGLIVQNSRRNANKLNMLVDAIANNDFSLKFSGRHLSFDERTINSALNRMADILRHEKINTAQREQFYSLILNCVKTGIVAIDERGYVVQTNDEALKTLNMNVFTHLRQLNRIDPQLETTLANIEPGERKHISLMNGTRETHLIVRMSKTVLQGKNVKIYAMDDIHTEMNEKEIDAWIKLTRVLTHEIMNSIAPITSLSDTLLKSAGNELPQRAREGISVIRNTSEGLMTFVESFRKFSALPTPKPVLIDVRQMLAETSELAGCHGDTPISIRVNPADLIVYADPNLIRQVIGNIIKNAIEAIAESGVGDRIAINAYADGDNVIIEIANNGPVIPEACAEQIFVPFFTTKDKGNGIGLSVSRQIMRLSGGNIALRRVPTAKFPTVFVLTFN